MRVPGEGPPKANIVIVGEAPGQRESLEGRPFVGSSGQLLNDMLVTVGISRSDCYITNVSKTRPPNNNFGRYYRDSKRADPTDELKRLREELISEVNTVGPNITIALGVEALKALTGKSPIGKWRGSLINGATGKTIGTFHPAGILRMYGNRAIAELDLTRARKESYTDKLSIPSHEFSINPSFREVMDYLCSLKRRVAFDIETTGNHVRCLALSDAPNRAICIPFIAHQTTAREVNGRVVFTDGESTPNSYWSLEEERAILKIVQNLMEDTSVEKIAQNFPFDSTILLRDLGIVVRGLWMDTMVAQHTCYSEMPKSLDFLCSIYTRVPRYSDYEVSSDLSTWTYNCYDASVTFEVAEKLEFEMKDLGVYEFYRDHCQPTMISLTRASNRGIPINAPLRDKLKLKEETRLETIKVKLKALTGSPLNPNSPKQMKEYLYGELGLPPQKKKRGEVGVTTNEEALEKLRVKFPKHHELLTLCIGFRKSVKLISTVLNAELDKGLYYTSYRATGTTSGRISSATTFFGHGGNIQQVHRGKVRRIFVAPEGCLFVKADLSQAEMRCVAWEANIKELVENFLRKDFDVHRWNATLIYGVELSEVTPDQRQQAKHCLHSANYMGSPATAVKHAKIPYAVAKHALENYKGALPRLSRWWDEITTEVSQTRRLTTPLGRVRLFFGRLDPATIRSAVSFKPQGTVGDIINSAFVKLDRSLQGIGYPLMQIHDEIVSVVREDRLGEGVDKVSRAMAYKLHYSRVSEDLVIPCEIKVGKNWYDLEEYEGC